MFKKTARLVSLGVRFAFVAGVVRGAVLVLQGRAHLVCHLGEACPPQVGYALVGLFTVAVLATAVADLAGRGNRWVTAAASTATGGAAAVTRAGSDPYGETLLTNLYFSFIRPLSTADKKAWFHQTYAQAGGTGSAPVEEAYLESHTTAEVVAQAEELARLSLVVLEKCPSWWDHFQNDVRWAVIYGAVYCVLDLADSFWCSNDCGGPDNEGVTNREITWFLYKVFSAFVLGTRLSSGLPYLELFGFVHEINDQVEPVEPQSELKLQDGTTSQDTSKLGPNSPGRKTGM